MRHLMLPNSYFSYFQRDIPLSIVPALPIKQQFRIINDIVDLLNQNQNINQKKLFLEIIGQLKEKKINKILKEYTRLERKDLWRSRNIGFMYFPEIIIHELFTQKSKLSILRVIQKILKSDTIDWVCLITQKTAYLFVLSANGLLLWSQIIPGLVEYILATLLIDSTVLDPIDDSLRWAILEEVKSQLQKYYKQRGSKTSFTLINEESLALDVFLQMDCILITQRSLLEHLDRQMLPMTENVDRESLEYINLKYPEFLFKQKIPTDREFLSLDPPILKIYDDFTDTITPLDFPWILDFHPLMFLEIIPQIRKCCDSRRPGEFYTPIALAEAVVFQSLETFFHQDLKRPITSLRVFDPAMGTGILLVYALEWLVNFMILKSSQETSFIDLRRKILHSCLVGNDIDQDIVSIGKNFLKLFSMSGTKKKELPISMSNDDFIESFLSNLKSKKPFPKYDIILSNPPYLAFHSRFAKNFAQKNELKTIRDAVPGFSGKRDNAYLIFLGICLQHLLTSNGVVGFVIDHSFLDLPSYRDIRKLILTNYYVCYILANYNYRKTAIVDLSLVVISKKKDDSIEQILWHETLNDEPLKVSKDYFLKHPNFDFKYQEVPSFYSHLNKKTIPLGELVTVSCGLEYGGLLKTHFLSSKKQQGFHKCIDGSNGLPQSYLLFWVPEQHNSFVRLDKEYEKYLQDTNQNVSKTEKQVILISGRIERFLTEKIILRQTASKFFATLDQQKYLTLRNTHLIYYPITPYTLSLVLGILNSSLGNWIGLHQNIIRKSRNKSSRYPQIRLNDLKRFPIIDLNQLDDDLLISQLDNSVKECLKIGKSVTNTLTKLWNILQESGFKFTSQRQFLRKFLSKNNLKRNLLNKKLQNVNTWGLDLQKELRRLSIKKKEIDSIVFKLYNISPQDQKLINKEIH